jgi:hypothetical protein
MVCFTVYLGPRIKAKIDIIEDSFGFVGQYFRKTHESKHELSCSSIQALVLNRLFGLLLLRFVVESTTSAFAFTLFAK